MSTHIYLKNTHTTKIDYQDEKPENEKMSFDVLIKDFLRSKLLLIYFWTFHYLLLFILLDYKIYFIC